MVDPFCFAFIWFKVQGSRFRVQGSRGGFAAFFIGRCPEVVFKSRVTSHNNDMSTPLEKGRAKGAGWIHEAV